MLKYLLGVVEPTFTAEKGRYSAPASVAQW